VAHIALAVGDQKRSRRFYERYFEFDASTARVADDGVLLIEGPDGVLLALAETDEAIRLPSFLHFGFRAAGSPAEVRAFRDRLAGDDIEIVEEVRRAGLRQRQVPRPGRLRDRVRLGARVTPTPKNPRGRLSSVLGSSRLAQRSTGWASTHSSTAWAWTSGGNTG